MLHIWRGVVRYKPCQLICHVPDRHVRHHVLAKFAVKISKPGRYDRVPGRGPLAGDSVWFREDGS